MKKAIHRILIFIAAMLIFCMSFTVCAAEVTTEPAATTEQTTSTTAQTTAATIEPTVPDEIKPTYTSQMWAFWEQYQTQTLQVITAVAMVITSIFVGIRNGKGIKNVQTSKDNDTKVLQDGIKDTTVLVKDGINATNGLIDAYNEMSGENKQFFDNLKNENMTLKEEFAKLQQGYADLQAAYEKYGETENDRNRVIGVVLAQNTAILEILQGVYATSAKLPQGIKDIVNIKYANALKDISKDEKMLAIVATVRENINAGAAYTGEEHNDA